MAGVLVLCSWARYLSLTAPDTLQAALIQMHTAVNNIIILSECWEVSYWSDQFLIKEG